MKRNVFFKYALSAVLMSGCLIGTPVYAEEQTNFDSSVDTSELENEGTTKVENNIDTIAPSVEFWVKTPSGKVKKGDELKVYFMVNDESEVNQVQVSYTVGNSMSGYGAVADATIYRITSMGTMYEATILFDNALSTYTLTGYTVKDIYGNSADEQFKSDEYSYFVEDESGFVVNKYTVDKDYITSDTDLTITIETNENYKLTGGTALIDFETLGGGIRESFEITSVGNGQFVAKVSLPEGMNYSGIMYLNSFVFYTTDNQQIEQTFDEKIGTFTSIEDTIITIQNTSGVQMNLPESWGQSLSLYVNVGNGDSEKEVISQLMKISDLRTFDYFLTLNPPHGNGQKLDYNGQFKSTVMLPIPENWDENKIKVVYYNDDTNTAELIDFRIEKNSRSTDSYVAVDTVRDGKLVLVQTAAEDNGQEGTGESQKPEEGSKDKNESNNKQSSKKEESVKTSTKTNLSLYVVSFVFSAVGLFLLRKLTLTKR